MEALYQIDLSLFHFINGSLSNIIFDFIMPLLREKLIWIPLYFFIVLYIIKYFGKKTWIILFVIILNFAFTDGISNQIFKKNFKRIRPCNELSLDNNIHERVACGSGFSFTSNHAANHFGLSFILIFTGVFVQRNHKILLVFWACIVAFAQVYVGVHYPFDVIAGAFLGITIAYIVSFFANRTLLKNMN